MGMEVDRAEVELAGDQEDQGADGRQGCEAVGAVLGEAVECFEEAIGLTGLRPSNNARGADARAWLPSLWVRPWSASSKYTSGHHGAHSVDLLSLKDLAQLFVVAPRAGRRASWPIRAMSTSRSRLRQGRAASDPDHDQQVRARLDRAARRRRGVRHRGSKSFYAGFARTCRFVARRSIFD